MIEKLIDDCEKALENNLYFAALSLALILPDICAKAEYSTEKGNKKRYINWCEKYFVEKIPDDMPYLNGKILYSLRCSVLHQGNPNIDEKDCNITQFELIVESKKPFGYGACDCFGISYEEISPNEKKILGRKIRLNLCELCQKICYVAKRYYENNKNKFNFFHYHLIDWDEEQKKYPPLDVGKLIEKAAQRYRNQGVAENDQT